MPRCDWLGPRGDVGNDLPLTLYYCYDPDWYHFGWDDHLWSLPPQAREVRGGPSSRQSWTTLRTPEARPHRCIHKAGTEPESLLVSRGGLAWMLDVGGLGPVGVALDLVSTWHLLECGPRQVLRADLGCGDLEWARGRQKARVFR